MEILNLWKFINVGPLGCSSESCPLQETYLTFQTTEKIRAFVINLALVLGFQAVGGGHTTASKVFSFLSLYTWSKNFELTNLR